MSSVEMHVRGSSFSCSGPFRVNGKVLPHISLGLVEDASRVHQTCAKLLPEDPIVPNLRVLIIKLPTKSKTEKKKKKE